MRAIVNSSKCVMKGVRAKPARRRVAMSLRARGSRRDGDDAGRHCLSRPARRAPMRGRLRGVAGSSRQAPGVVPRQASRRFYQRGTPVILAPSGPSAVCERRPACRRATRPSRRRADAAIKVFSDEYRKPVARYSAIQPT
jgi:hypothetical protein